MRGSLTGSVVGNLLLVLGFSLLFGGRGDVDRESSFTSLALIAVATLLFLIPSIPGLERRQSGARFARGGHVPGRDRAPAPVRGRDVDCAAPPSEAAPARGAVRRGRVGGFRVALGVLAVATVVTALIAEALVGSLVTFADDAGLSEFFVAAVIVAIVGNAAQRGGAVVVAYRGRIKLAAEIALASSTAQVAVFLIPAVALLSWAIDPLALSFRFVEFAVVALATILTAALLAQGRSSNDPEA